MTVVRALYDFQILVDTDFGVFKYIKTHPNLRKPTYFDEKIMVKSNVDVLKVLINRESLNPLDAFAVKDKVGKLDNIYYQLMETPDIYKDILKLSMPTDMLNVFRAGNNVPNNAHVGKIMYYNDTELEFITENLKIPESSCVKFESQMNLAEYGTILINIYKDILKFDIPSVEGKYIYTSDHQFNLSYIDVFGGFKEPVPNASVTHIINRNIAKKNIIEIRSTHNLKKMEEFTNGKK